MEVQAEDFTAARNHNNSSTALEIENDTIKTALRINKKEANYKFIDSINPNTSYAIDFISIRVLNKKATYETNKNHTLIFEVENTSNNPITPKLEAALPPQWNLISISDLGELKPNQKKMLLVSFYIPNNTSPGDTIVPFVFKNKSGNIIGNQNVTFDLGKNYDLEVFNLFTSEKLQAGETIEGKYEIKNKGNVAQEINISSINTILGEKTITLLPNESITVELSQKTDPKKYTYTSARTNLNVLSTTSGETYKLFNSTQVFPTKLIQQDPFFRFPVRASLYYNSQTNKTEHFSTLSAEITGEGFLDLAKNNYLNFIIRAPQQTSLGRFGVTDQYSLTYKHKDNTTVYLGDHAYYINRLGFDTRYGMGFKIDQNVKDWTLSAFYTKPRLFDFNTEALYGFKAEHHFSKNMHLGFALERSKGTITGANKNIASNEDEVGQIATFNFEYSGKNTIINAESSTSMTNQNVDFANYLSLTQKYKRFRYSGNFTIAGENYFGSIRNSLRYSNNLFYKKGRFDAAIGQTVSRVNQRLDPLFFAAEPYFENYYAKLGYRLGNRNYFSVRLDNRIREDQLEPKNYYYKEYGVNYKYSYSNAKFSIGFNGRISKTQNLLSLNNEYRNSYSHTLNSSYRFSDHFSLRGSFGHNYNNRYGSSGVSSDYYRYGIGFNYNFNKNLIITSSYNSGFSPEESYLKRDFLNAKVSIRASKNHRFEFWANYYENPGNVNNKELLAFGKYTYSFGVPIKRILENGGVDGNLIIKDKNIDIKGIKIIAIGKSIVTDNLGHFELNNLPVGKNYILLDESTLPYGVIPATKTPFQVVIEQDKKANLNIELVKSATVVGNLIYSNFGKPSINNLEGYLKLENDDFTYTLESNSEGRFKFQNIVPGSYKLTLIRHKGDTFFEMESNTPISVTEGEKITIDVPVKGKDRKIKFKTKNFKIGS